MLSSAFEAVLKMAPTPLLDRVIAHASRMRTETGKEPFLIYLGSSKRCQVLAQTFRERGLIARVSHQGLFVIVEGS